MTLDASSDIYDDDESHPIPFLGAIGYIVTSDQGVYYGITIATPLGADERSQKRLIRKIEVYLRDLCSNETRSRLTEVQRKAARIVAGVHPHSALEIFQLLDKCRPWAKDNGVVLDIKADTNIAPAN